MGSGYWLHSGNRQRVCPGSRQVRILSIFIKFKLSTRRGLNVVLVARDKKALEKLAVEVKAEGVEAKDMASSREVTWALFIGSICLVSVRRISAISLHHSVS